jgi:hypothetical protein
VVVGRVSDVLLQEGEGEGDVALEGGGQLEGEDEVELAIILLRGCRGGEGRLADMLVGSHFDELLLSIRVRNIAITKEDQSQQSWI